MIGLGAKYLKAAGFGRYRITAASLGSAKVIWPEWLTAATKQAIMAAFGADGTAVIRATNEYLNGIAAQGQAEKAKATALAALINEDPMMVCSLGLEPQGVTMPVRWLVGTNGARIDPLYAANANTTFKDIMYAAAGINSWIFTDNSLTWANKTTGYIQNASSCQMFIGGSSTTVGNGYARNNNPVVDRKVVIETTTTSYIYDGMVFNSGNGGNFSGEPMLLWFEDKLKHAMLGIKESGVEVRTMYPMKLGKAWSADKVSTGVAQAIGTCGMVDVITEKFYPNAGSGSFTIPDISYTPTP